MKTMFVAALLALSLSACASSGTQVDPATVASFVRGSTTANQVQAALGEPNTMSMLPDGSRVMVYTYAHTQARPETFIPLIGGLVGGADSQIQTASFTFGPDSVLQTSSRSQTQIGTGTGLSAR
jgi:outer membrane protein assembly factor BamE (lipoprotein component of BamABCDE complex)